MFDTERQLLAKLRTNEYPDVAEDGKGFFVVWADGRGIVGYKNKKHAIAFIEQGDRDAISATYREKQEGKKEVIRNIYSPDKSSDIHGMLLKEAQARRDHNNEVVVNDILFGEAEDRLDKSAMSRQSGGSTLRNSGWNTTWDFVDPTPDIENVKTQVKQNASTLFGGMGSQVDLRPSPLAFVFRYIRTILPDKNEESGRKAENALNLLDQVLPGFKQFQQDIEHSQIPLSPYFITSNFSKSNGRVTSESLNSHISSEIGREMKLPDGRRLPNDSHYTQHTERINSGGTVRPSDYWNTTRVFSMSEVDKVPNASWLMQAIEDKINSGYNLDSNVLWQALIDLLEKKLEENNLDYRQGDPGVMKQIETYNQHYKALFYNIEEWWNDRENKSGMTAFMLRIVLKSLSYTGGGMPDVAQDVFRIPNASSPFLSNGWDSSRGDPSTPMLTLPPLRQLPHGEVVPDRGNGNMSYDHLVLNWKGGLDQIFSKWGEKCEEWLRVLFGGQVMSQIAQQSPEAYEAWENVRNNRTGAEGILGLLEKYPDWDSFNRNHLQKSLASEIRSVNSLLKNPSGNNFAQGDLLTQIQGYVHRILEIGQENPEQAGEHLKTLSSELCAMYKNQQLDWDTLTLLLQEMNMPSRRNPYIKGNGLTSLRKSEKKSMIDQAGFEALKQHGYQIAKIMDFLYAVMSRSCHEQVNTRHDGAVENFYGHQYSTSSGKSSGGDILLSIEYTQLDGVSSANGVEVTEKQNFTLGQRSGANEDPVILRSSLPWQQMVDAFNELYPEAGYHLSTINEPISRNLDTLEVAVKEALNETRGQIQVIYHNNAGETEVLSGEELAQDKLDIADGAESSTSVENEGQNWQQQWQTPTSPESVVDNISAPEAPNQAPPALTAPSPTPSIPQEEKSMVKPMENDSLNYLQKRRNKGRRLFRERAQVTQFGSVEERLQKVANRLDEHGEWKVSDKIDLLLQKLCEVSNARKKSNI